ncbi:hypothetical protein K461DRAFT_106933 [Myriangium duriaei CBS 260.36]|uniref:Uncharacterized protein n=1 Tax=Myriangium duriaei CBS 260.36 TaxID=1168546 RepID=A0A9P4J9S7_9PEZI|nr:hypothetical protein K461DRAFT_106933 [Myriangium duriaei CBS 260.36]
MIRVLASKYVIVCLASTKNRWSRVTCSLVDKGNATDQVTAHFLLKRFPALLPRKSSEATLDLCFRLTMYRLSTGCISDDLPPDPVRVRCRTTDVRCCVSLQSQYKKHDKNPDPPKACASSTEFRELLPIKKSRGLVFLLRCIFNHSVLICSNINYQESSTCRPLHKETRKHIRKTRNSKEADPWVDFPF